MVVVRRHRELEQTPSLVNLDLTNEVRSPRAADAVRTIRASQDARSRSTRRVPTLVW